MDTKVNYTVIGLFVVLLASALVFIAFWLTSINDRKVYHNYYVYLKESITGLNVQSAVRYSGIRVGYVDSLEIDPKDPERIRLLLKITPQVPVTTSTVATLASEGLTGIAYINLKATNLNGQPLHPHDGDQYPVIATQPSVMLKITQAIPQIALEVENMTKRLNEILSKENQQAITSTLGNMNKVTKTLASNTSSINASIKSAQVILKNSAMASKTLPKLIDQIHLTLQEVEAAGSQFGQAGRDMSEAMRDTRLAIQNVSNQMLPSVQLMVDQLNAVMGNVKNLTADLNRNPSILVRGRSPQAPGPGERND